MSRFITIDTGGTNIKYALMDENAMIYDQDEIPTPHDSLETYVETLGQIYDKYADEDIEAVCMSAPGRIDASTGYFYTGGALQYMSEVDLAAALKDRIPVFFCAENDAKAAALAEMWKGCMQDVQNGIIIVLGTGIGGAVIINGQLYRGSTFAAGEFSCIPNSWQSRYPSEGTWSQTNGVGTLTERYALAAGLNPREVNGRVFFDAVSRKDPKALAELEWYCETLAAGIAGLQAILDVEKVAIGGGISRQPILEETLCRTAENMFHRLPFYFPQSAPEITTCAFSSDANMVGALYHYLHELKPAMQADAEN